MATIPEDKAPRAGLNIYGTAAVNPYKLTIAAEELVIPYNYVHLDIPAGDLKTEWFASLNPNRKVPAIVHVKEDGTSVTVFESAACLLYIVSEFDTQNKLSYPFGTPEYWTQVSWLSWQVSAYGPTLGQATHFNRYAVESVPYGSWRYTSEAHRLQNVLDKQLSDHPFVAGDRLTIADVAIFVFAHAANWCGIALEDSPHVKKWHDKLVQRPAFRKALQVPVPYPYSDEAVNDPNAQEFYRNVRKFGGQMIKADSDRWKVDVVPLPSDHANLGL